MSVHINGNTMTLGGRTFQVAESFAKSNPEIFGGAGGAEKELRPRSVGHGGADTGFEVAPKTQQSSNARPGAADSITTYEDKLNKTERRWLASLRNLFPGERIGIQDHTLRLGFDLRFTPDFTFWDGEQYTLDDVKGGKIWEDSTIKIKAAAALHPRWRFRVVQWIRETQEWKIKIIKP